jgi:hypothetical protein
MGGGPRGADLRRDTLTCPEFRLLERSTHSAEDRFLALTARSQGPSCRAAEGRIEPVEVPSPDDRFALTLRPFVG